jgi:C_GCAxxG_C_C family probable redox protein
LQKNIEVNIRNEYKALPKNIMLQKAYDFGVAYESHSFSCSQSTVAALYRLLDFPVCLVKAACSNAGGAAGQLVGTCGGIVGGMMVLDYFYGRSFNHMSDNEIVVAPNLETLSRAIQVSKQLPNKFISAFSAINCANIQYQLYGRLFYMADDDEMGKFEKAGGHSDPKKCPDIVGRAAKWTLEILLRNGDAPSN